MKKKTILAELLRKGAMLTPANVLYASGADHIGEMHMGLSVRELSNRAALIEDGRASTFRNERDLAEVLTQFSSDLYVLEKIAEIVEKDFYGRWDECEVVCDSTIGIVVDEDGETVETEVCRFVLDFKGDDYRNRIHGMPYDIVSMYPVE